MLHSPLLDALRLLRTQVPETRALTSGEMAQLLSQGNVFHPGCQVLAGPDFHGDTVHGNRFQGRVVLGGQVYHSVLEDVELGPGVSIDRCSLVRRVRVEAGASLRNSSVDCSSTTSYGLGTEIKAGLETRGREIPIWDAMTLSDGVRYLSDGTLKAEVLALLTDVPFDRSVVGPQVQMINAPWVDRVFLGPGTRILGAQRIDEVTVLSSLDEAVVVGAGVHVTKSVLQWGVVVDSAAQVSRSILLEYSGAERQALVTESLLGPNTVVGAGEVTASFLGPFVGFHHQSLLIATWWPEGRGNVGYGANIGSNHTSRAPDQELWAGEGTFFGLGTAVKFPANFQEAPYTIVASGVVTLPQRLGLPFSLIHQEPSEFPGARGLNRVIPGWVLRENVYLLLRNEGKFFQRNRARRHTFDLRIFRPEVVDKLWKAREILGSIKGKPVYTHEDHPGVGKNYLLEADRLAAVATYGEFLEYAALKLYYEAHHPKSGGEQELHGWLSGLFDRLGLDFEAAQANFEAYFRREELLWTSSLRAKERDDLRGSLIIPDYVSVHRLAEDDEFLRTKQQELAQIQEKIFF